ncbi:MAG: hypothetical protein VB089_03590 [Anaerolineaceae bacterium]|nr:hypothetical protein [Anaerolineaceae bacterium]
MLILEPNLNHARAYRLENGAWQTAMLSPGPDGRFDLASLAPGHPPERLAYVLAHGGNTIHEPVLSLDRKALPLLQACLPFDAAQGRVTLALAAAGLEQFPRAQHYLLCETALFKELPPWTLEYALPDELQSLGVHRYGGGGLCHEWAIRTARPALQEPLRVISLCLDERPNAAAFMGEHVIESSFGFSTLESIPSWTGCGNLDPSIPLLLHQQEQDPAAVEHLLRDASGLQALSGEPDLTIMLRSAQPRARLARDLLAHHLFLAVGACMAALGGLDALLISASPAEDWSEMVQRLCRQLEFTGLSLRAQPVPAGTLALYSSPVSPIQVAGLPYRRPPALAELLAWHTQPAAPGRRN